MILTIIIFILTLLFLVVIHELGHFLMAKKFGIKVEEFGFGIPPRAWGKKIGETLVSINWLPFGGFVKLLGEDQIDKNILENKRSFAFQTVFKRIVVVIAGVAMNFILAFALFYFILGYQGFKISLPLLTDHQFVGVNQQNQYSVVIANVSKNSPAEIANLKKGEIIYAVDSEPIKGTNDFIAKTKNKSSGRLVLTVFDEDGKNYRSVFIFPRDNPPAGEGPLGVALVQVGVANLEYKTFPQKLFSGPVHSWNLVAYSGKILGNLVGEFFRTKDFTPVSHSVAGPVGITSAVNTILTESVNPFLAYLNFIALLSLNLAVMNVLPFPALDGGRLFFLLIEAVTRRKVHAGVEKWIHTVGMAILLTLMLLVTFSDIKKFFP